MEDAAGDPSDDLQGNVVRRRKFTIQSTFGQARERRSRKSRPCDACRKRKTACVITDAPPCRFCKSRGLQCTSSGLIGEEDAAASSSAHANSAEANANISPDPNINGDFQSMYVSPAPAMGPSYADPYGFAPNVISPVSMPSNSLTPIKYESPQSSSPEQTRSNSRSIPPSGSASGDTVTTYTKGNIEGMGVWPTNGPGRVHTLEDNVNKTANALGATAEQDTYILDSFRYMIVSEIDEIDADYLQVYPGSQRPNDPPVHFLLLENEVPEYTMRPKQIASDEIEKIIFPYGPNLVQLYFKYVHPVYPVVSKVRFLRLYASEKERIPASLRGALYALACVFWTRDPTISIPCPFEQHELHTRAQSSLRAELENPNLANLQACLLLLHMAPPWTDTVETPSIWILSAQAVSCAQMSGIHKDCSDWSIEPWEKKLRTKLWWAIYAADCWTSICNGNPPHISPCSFSTGPLDIEDMRFDEDVPDDLKYLVDPESWSFEVAVGARFVETINVTKMVRETIDAKFLVNPSARWSNGIEPDTAGILEDVRERLNNWPSLLPQCLSTKREGGFPIVHNNCALHLSYFAAQALLYRALMYPASKAARADPTSSLRRWFPYAVNEMEQFVAFMDTVTEMDLRGFWGRLARSHLILCGNFLIYLFIVASNDQDIKIAHERLLTFHKSLQRLTTTEYYIGKLLLRPVALRIDSFFQQAGEIIRRGGHGYWQLASLDVFRDNQPNPLDEMNIEEMKGF